MRECPKDGISLFLSVFMIKTIDFNNLKKYLKSYLIFRLFFIYSITHILRLLFRITIVITKKRSKTEHISF